MNRQELHDALVVAGVRSDAFDVLGCALQPVPGDLYVLRKVRNGLVGRLDRWAVCYSERGLMRDVQEYSTEREACDAFWVLVPRDLTVFDRPA